MAVRCRKNQATLSAVERDRFVAALLSIKASGVYDTFVAEHMGAMSNAHRGPAFLPWHREYLRRFELALQKVDPQVTLPYWNWSIDNSPTSSLWDPTFLGGNGRPSDGVVTTGPFAQASGKWPLIYDGPALRRRFGLSASSLPTPADIAAALNESLYDVAPWSTSSTSGFRNFLEGWINGPQLHNRVHVWVGGSMAPMSSPNDPVFFMHHCFVDKLWVDWQAMHPGSGFLPMAGAPIGHNFGDAMEPWLGQGETVTIASVIDHHALGYAYDTEAICQPTLKFADDLQTLKFTDDPQTLKFTDDPQTLKFTDDPQTLKFRDDPQTLKFTDDGGAGVTANKALDDVKIPALDDPNVSKPLQDSVDPVAILGRPAPFVLSTPHHSMAWAQNQPGAWQAAAAQLESELSQLSEIISDHERGQQLSQLTATETEALRQYRAEYQSILVEYQQLINSGIA